MNNVRAKNLSLNIVVGYITQVGVLLLQFFSRRIFVLFLSEEYLGVNGLYSNILNVLSLAELGLNTVVQFYFYKPVAQDDRPMIRTLLSFFRKIYIFIAIAVLGVGVGIIPLLQYIVNSSLPENELILYYVVFLINTVVSYFSAQKIALLAAYQDNRLQKVLTLFTNVLLQIFHIIVLVVWEDFLLYLLVTLVTTSVNVILLNTICNKRYPYIKKKGEPVSLDKKSIVRNVGSTFLYKVGGVLINNTDNILISILVSTAAVGLYSNYNLIVLSVQGFIAIITTSLISLVGNLSAEKQQERMKEAFYDMLLFYHFIACYGGVSLMLLLNEFIPIWLGDRYLLGFSTVVIACLNFYVTNAVSPIWMYREANGLFRKVKFLLLITAGINIVLSIAFGILWGLLGIILATLVARLLTQVWYEPKILFGTLFGESAKPYWFRQLKYFLLSIISFVICYGISLCLPKGLLFIILKAFVFLLVCLVIFYVGNVHTNEVKNARQVAKKIYLKIKNKES